MLGSPRGNTSLAGCELIAVGGDFYMNCTHLVSAENGKPPDGIHPRRQRAEAEANNEGAQIVKNTAQQSRKATKQELAGMSESDSVTVFVRY